jgi:hypothetical protein
MGRPTGLGYSGYTPGWCKTNLRILLHLGEIIAVSKIKPYAEVGTVTLKSNGNEALSDEFLLNSNGDEALSNVFS